MARMVVDRIGGDFDFKTFCQNLQATKPPYECPIQGCGKVYKSYPGIKFHLYNVDHANPESSPGKTPSSARKGGRPTGRGGWQKAGSPSDFAQRETLSYAEAQRLVEVDFDGKLHRINIYEPLEIIPQDEIDNCDNTEKEELSGDEKDSDEMPQTPSSQHSSKDADSTKDNKRGKDGAKSGKHDSGKSGKSGKTRKGASKSKDIAKGKEACKGGKEAAKGTDGAVIPGASSSSSSGEAKLPEATFRVIDDYVKPPEAPPLPLSYYRFIDKTVEEMDDEVEYDMDEEDYAWLELINEQRRKDSQPAVAQETFELLMDRFEKEAFFQSQNSGREVQPSIDEDAVCSICMDGECQNTNVILFCDMCNLAVHQECYGVPYIPEGQWLCRRCLQSPSRAVDCCLCPNKGGAFKQTNDNRWAHVVCALWIPEVGFSNIVFLEPIDSIEQIPAARWKLSCYICKQRGTGACIQCHKTNCYTAFHVTCAQQAGLYMRIEPVRETGANGTTFSVRKTAFCDMHTPPEGNFVPMMDNGISDDEGCPSSSLSPAEAKAVSRQKMRRARKILAEKRAATPVVSLPVIPKKRLEKICIAVSVAKKSLFINRLLSYWKLKRQSRNGVPLLRRLQSNHMARSEKQVPVIEDDKQNKALKEQLKYWQRLRQDLEKARLLVELIRKREKLKREQLRIHQMATEIQLQPFGFLLRHTLEQLQEKDPSEYFAEPVDLREVPDYPSYVKTPMDFLTMQDKIDKHEYRGLDEFEDDFDLIVNNCMTYNGKDTPFYRAAVKLRDQGGAVIRSMRRMAERVGFDQETGLLLCDAPKVEQEPLILEDVDSFLPPEVREKMPLEEQLRLLLDKLDMTNCSRPNRRSRVAKQIKREITKVRKQLALQKDGREFLFSDAEDTSVLDTASEAAVDTLSDHSPSPPPLRRGRTHSRSISPSATEEDAIMRAHRASPAKLMTPKRRGRPPGRPKKNKIHPDTDTDGGGDGKRSRSGSQVRDHSEKDQGEESNDSPSTPTGVNRRTSVLFSKKSSFQKNGSQNQDPPATSSPQTPIKKGPGRPPRQKPIPEKTEKIESQSLEKSVPIASRLCVSRSSSSSSSSSSSTSSSSKSDCAERENARMTSPGCRKRSASVAHITSNPDPSPCDAGPSPSKRSMSVTEPPNSVLVPPPTSRVYEHSNGPSDIIPHHRRESFLQYRMNHSDLDSSSDNGSSDDDSPGSDLETDSSSSTSDGRRSSHHRYSKRMRRRPKDGRWSSEEDEDVIPLEPLDLVWAKCRGYPWYPALIINPKMPKTGFLHNGVPIPVPPEEVLLLQRKYECSVYLVLFFDAKRTWQWLPRNKLEPLGVDSGLDKVKLYENKKNNVKAAVKKAYEKAINHRCRVTGEPNPLAFELDSGEDE